MELLPITEREFGQVSALLMQRAGIHLTKAKIPLVMGRLSGRLRALRISRFEEYFRRISSGSDPRELQTAIDLLTTNETRFFREPKHFDLLETWARDHAAGQPFRVWSAACSSGEEPYTIAMMLAEVLGERPWQVVASDLSTRVLQTARAGLYKMERANGISVERLRRHCLKGVGRFDGTFLISDTLRKRIEFQQINLNEKLPSLGQFDAIFLRNVMIYFNADTKRQVVSRLAPLLKRGGHFLVGHSETLNGVTDELTAVAPSVYRRT